MNGELNAVVYEIWEGKLAIHLRFYVFVKKE
jgi:hypothetical protein